LRRQVTQVAGYEINAVRGRLDDDVAERLVAFWTSHGVLTEEAARSRLESVVCVLTDGSGEIAGVNSVVDEAIPAIGGRRFWLYRSFLAPGVAGPVVVEGMIDAARAALEAEFDPGGDGPVGLFAAIADRAVIRALPEAIWPESQMLYVGYTPDSRQMRIRYFEGAVIGPGAT
jgi:hypothetical protein